MGSIKIYLEFDKVLEQALAENHLSIADILQHENVEAKVTHGVSPYPVENGARTKDVVTIILVSSIAIGSVGFAISQILNAIYNRPHFREYEELVELRDGEGNILFDKECQPIFKSVKHQKIIVADKQEEMTMFEAKFSVLNGLIIRFGAEKKH